MLDGQISPLQIAGQTERQGISALQTSGTQRNEVSSRTENSTCMSPTNVRTYDGLGSNLDFCRQRNVRDIGVINCRLLKLVFVLHFPRLSL